jgi:iron uptake system component EfeO
MRFTVVAITTAVTLPVLLTSCTSKSDPASGGDIGVTAGDSACDVARDSAETGNVTFQITNNGSKVTEFYVYGVGDRVVGEVENIGPGLTRQLIVSVPDPGKYETACKPGMVGDGIRHDFTVTGQTQSRDATGKLADAAAGYSVTW